MKFSPFLLEQWIEQHQDAARYNLAVSTGPKWTLAELRTLMTDAERDALERVALTYCPAGGRESLRAEIAAMYGADPDDVQIFTGGAEALLALLLLDSAPQANVVVPWPSFPPFVELPETLGFEVRRYRLTQANGFDVDVEQIIALTDANTKLILVNSPHNPSGSIVPEDTICQLDAFAAQRGIEFVVDEVYHPIYQGVVQRSAGEYSRATVLGDFSKAFALPGLRVGWLLERNRERRIELTNARGYCTVSTSMLGEMLAEIAARNRDKIWSRSRTASAQNLAALEPWCAAHDRHIEWLRPHGGMTAFPRLRFAGDARPLCLAAAARGVLLAPGDCFGSPEHFRIGFGLEMPDYGHALDILSDVVEALAST